MELLEIGRRLERIKDKTKGVALIIPKKKVNILLDLAEKRFKMSNFELITKAYQMHLVMRGTKDALYISLPNCKDGYFFVEGNYITTQSCTFYPKALAEAQNLTKLGSITTYHSYGGHPSFLRPSIDEAIWQCPKEWQEQATAFEFSYPKTELISDVYDSELDLHVLTTTYYKCEIPDIVKQKRFQW